MAKKQNNMNLQTSKDIRALAVERLEQKHLSTGVSALSPLSTPEEMLRVVHELDVHKIELEMQQEDLARTRIELEDSLTLYTELYDFAPVGYLTLGRDSKIQLANLTATRLLGVDRSRLQGLRLKNLVVPEDHRLLDALLENVFTTKETGTCEVKLLADSAQPSKAHQTLFGRIVRVNAAISETEYACRVILSDISEQKNAENEQHRLTRILRATTLCNQALIHSTDEMELVQKICNIVVDIGGYRMAWIGYAEHDKEKSVRPIAQSGSGEGYLETVTISWDDTEFGRGPTGTAIRTGKLITSIDIINDPKMKQWRSEAIKHGYASSLSLPLKADHEVFGALSIYSSHPGALHAEEIELLTTLADNLAYGIAMLRTRHARQKVQDELSRSHDLMHFILQATNAGFWQHDLSTNTSTLSDEVWKLYGLKPNSHKNPYDAWIGTIIPEDRETVEQAVQEALKTSGEYSCRWRVLNPDGTFRWLLSKGAPVKDSKGQIVRYAGLVLDITDQKKKEDALTESEERFKTLFEKHSSVMLIIDPDSGRVFKANNAAVAFYGWSIDQLCQMYIQQINTLSSEEIKSAMEKSRTGEQNHFFFQHRIADNSVRDVEVFSITIAIGGKNFLYSIIHDITDRKLAENELRQSEERFRKMFEEHSAIKLVVDVDTGNITDANQSAADFYGYSIAKLRTMRIQEITNLSSEEFGDRMQQVRLSGKKQFLSQHRMADGSLRDVEVFTNAIESGGKELFFSIIQDITEKKAGEQKIRDYVKQLEGAMKSTLEAVAKVVEAHDPYTAGHDCRVGQISADIAREMGWSEETCQTMQLVGLVHDIGKMSIPAEILTKPCKLSAIEFELVKTHAENGYEILHDVKFPLPIARIILEHHERMDGSGYPHGLKGENTLPESRILAVADVLEAMASDRPYRASLGIEAAISEIETHRGSLFDPVVVDAMLRLFREKGYHLPD
jgi:PAS domain S-box-containing protein/putative nucleotidyltransferase with HDIG domain